VATAQIIIGILCILFGFLNFIQSYRLVGITLGYVGMASIVLGLITLSSLWQSIIIASMLLAWIIQVELFFKKHGKRKE